MIRGSLSPVAAPILAAALGCGSKGEEQGAAGSELRAAVDPALPKDAQARQRVIVDILTSLTEGYPVERIQHLVPGVRFNETQPAFLEGTLRLVRWGFGGPPGGEAVPVVLLFATKEGSRESDQAVKRVERAYLVKLSAGRATVTRR
jgi:hypothetical protein